MMKNGGFRSSLNDSPYQIPSLQSEVGCVGSAMLLRLQQSYSIRLTNAKSRPDNLEL